MRETPTAVPTPPTPSPRRSSELTHDVLSLRWGVGFPFRTLLHRASWRATIAAGLSAAALLVGAPRVAMAEGGHEMAESEAEAHGDGEIGEAHLTVEIEHPYPNDLVVELRHQPEEGAAVTVEVANRPHVHEGHDPFEHHFDLTEALEGRPVAGTWTVMVGDEAFGDHGALEGWSLNLERCLDGVCEEATIANDANVDIHDLEFNPAKLDFLAAVINFTLLLFILIYFGRKPMKSFLVGRRRQIEEDLVEARELKEQAEKKYEEYSSRLEKLDDELEAIRAEMVHAGEEERDRIVAEAEKKAARMRRDAQFIIDQQLKQLRVDLTEEAVEAAIQAAEEVLRSAVTPADQKRLADDYLERLKVVVTEQAS